MSDIETRLKETSAACLAAYTEWSNAKKDSAKREALLDAVHELRKAAARVEIEVAVAEGSESGQKKIPIPEHRSAKHRGKSGNMRDNEDDGSGNALPSFIAGDDNSGQKKRTPRGRKLKRPESEA